jgi:hypothetical protein
LPALVVSGATWFAVRRINNSQLTTTGGGKIQSKLLTFAGANKNTLAAVAMFAVGILILWIWRKTIFAFPSMSALEQTMTAAGILFAIMAIYGVWLIYQKGDSVWPQRFAVAGFVGIFLFGGLTWMFGERWVSDPITQEAFDIRTGEPNYMGYLDSGGIWTRGSLGGDLLVPADCRSEGTNHAGFDYASNGTCFSPVRLGVRMIPISDENVPILPDTRLFNTLADIRAEEELRQPEATRSPQVVLAPPRAPDFAEICDGFHARALADGRLIECYTGTLFAGGEDLILPARDDACFSTNQSALIELQGIDEITVDPTSGEQTDGPDGSFEAYRVSTRHGNTVEGITVWFTRDGSTFQRYECNKST